MNFFGLARRSVFRKPVKSILLLLIVFAISTLLLAGVASKNASIEVQDKTRQAIGAGFLLERNAEYRTKRLRECSEKIGKVSTEYVAPKQDVQSISVEVTPEMYLLDGVSVLVLITASVLVSGIVILKRNPKDILSEMS